MAGILSIGPLGAEADVAPLPPPTPAPVPAPAIPKVHQDRALRYGAFVGGTASQYDLCASKGLLPPNQTTQGPASQAKKPPEQKNPEQKNPEQKNPAQKPSAPAEPIARTLIGKLKQPNGGPDLSPYALQGWELAKQDLAKHTADYTRDKCAKVAAAWTALIAGMPSS